MKLFGIPMVVTSLAGLCLLSGVGAPPAHADFTLGEPVNIDTVEPFLSDPGSLVDCFPSDGLEMFLESERAGGRGSADIWVLKRASPEDDWGPPENLGPTVNSASAEFGSSITGDGLELYFTSTRPGGYDGYDLYVAKRATRDSPWGPATNLGSNVNSSRWECFSSVSSDGLELYFMSTRPGGYGGMDIWVSKRATRNDPWGPAANLGSVVNSPAGDTAPCLSPDGLLLFLQDYAALRPGGYGGGDFWVTRRASRSAPWEPLVNLGPIVNGPTADVRPCLAPDGSALYFGRESGATITHWRAPLIPIVDFNGDGKVDLTDLVVLIDNWGTNKTLYDIGPMPWGDGKVDIEDLKVFIAEWEKQNPPAVDGGQ